MQFLRLWWADQTRLLQRLMLAALLVAVIALGLRIPRVHAAEAVVATIGVGDLPLGVGVNAITNRIYVANAGSNAVSVIDGVTNTVVATVAVGTGPLGVGVNAITNRIYVANAGSNAVSVIDGVTNTVVATVPVEGGARGVGV